MPVSAVPRCLLIIFDNSVQLWYGKAICKRWVISSRPFADD